MIVSGIHEHRKAANFITSGNTIPTLSIQFCLSDPTIILKLCRRRFPFKTAFDMTKRLRVRRLKRVAIYPQAFVFSPWTFSRTSSLDDVAVATVERRPKTCRKG